MTRSYRYLTVDVFTDKAFGGNQLAVVLDADGLSAEEMQTITREFNYSESTFVLPATTAEAARRVRIFTPAEEMPFAGHPTVGTTFVLIHEGIVALRDAVTEIVLEEKIGPVTVRIERRDGSPFIWMRHRPPEWGPVIEDRAAVAAMLGLTQADLLEDAPAQVVSTGVPFLFVPVRSLDAIKRCRLDMGAVAEAFGALEPVSVFAFTPEAETAEGTVHSRMFANHTMDIPEDPATGAASGPLGAYLVRYGLVPAGPRVHIVSEQGFEIKRPSMISITVDMSGDEIGEIWIGGEAVLVAEGTLYVP